MTIVTLLSDFGTQDEYVGVMKGVIAGINPDARVVDITHSIEPQDITHGAYILAAAYRYFPAGTLHVAVVDPGVGGARRILAVECHGHRFLAPDNGLLERVLTDSSDSVVVSVQDRRYYLERVSDTFHGRDIFAPVAARLAAGLPLAALGPVIDRQRIVSGAVPRWRFSTPRCIDGIVVAVDRFGNLMTNIEAAAIHTLSLQGADGRLTVEIADKRIDGIGHAYDQVHRFSPLAIIGSRGLLEISVNRGDARRTLGVEKNDRVRVCLTEDD